MAELSHYAKAEQLLAISASTGDTKLADDAQQAASAHATLAVVDAVERLTRYLRSPAFAATVMPSAQPGQYRQVVVQPPDTGKS